MANTGLFGFSMRSWCGLQSTNSVATVQQYLDTMAMFETQYPSMRVVGWLSSLSLDAHAAVPATARFQ